MCLKRHICCLILVSSILLLISCTYRTAGLIVNTGSEDVIVFDPSTNEVLGSVRVPGVGPAVNTAIISRSGLVGFVQVGHLIYMIDMDADPPVLAGGINPITLTPTVKDLVASPDEYKYLAVGPVIAPTPGVVSVFSPIGEMSTFDPDNNGAVSVDVCDDQTIVLVGTRDPAVVKKLILAEDGTISDTGESLDVPYQIANVYCAPGSQVGVVVSSVFAETELKSFVLSGMISVDTRVLAVSEPPAEPRFPVGLSGAFTAGGPDFFIRSSEDGGDGYIEKFDINPVTGAIDDHPGFPPHVSGAMAAIQGPEVLAVYEAGDKIFIPMPWDNRIKIIRASTGDSIGYITSELFNRPTTISIVEEP